MDAKLNPISSSTAGVPLSVETLTTRAKRSRTNERADTPAIQDTLETSEREGDGRQLTSSTPAPTDKTNQGDSEHKGSDCESTCETEQESIENSGQKTPQNRPPAGSGQGSLLDLQG